MPCASAVVEQVAVRVLPEPPSATAEQPLMLLAPSRNATFPVGATPVTVAVNVTYWPTVDGLSEEASAVVLTAFTTCESVELVDVALEALPA